MLGREKNRDKNMTYDNCKKEGTNKTKAKEEETTLHDIEAFNRITTRTVVTTTTSSTEDRPDMRPSRENKFRAFPTCMITVLIIALGAATCVAFMIVGITDAKDDQKNRFALNAADLIKKIQGSLEDYATAASWIHGQCRSRNFTRQDFRQTYEYLIASGLEFQAVEFLPNISHAERPESEQEARQFYEQHYPHIHYQCFRGFNYENSTIVERRLNTSYYMPVHYVEPVVGNEAAIDFDVAASGSRRQTVLYSTRYGKPALTDRLRLVQEKAEDGSAYGVVLLHPGVNVTFQRDTWPRDLAAIVLRVPDLLKRSVENQAGAPLSMYIFDKSDCSGLPLFLGGAQVIPEKGRQGVELTYLPEINIKELRKTKQLYMEEDVEAANKVWTVCVTALDGTYEADILFVLLGSIIIAVASVFLALWVYMNARRVEQFSTMKAAAEAEKASLILKSAKEATKAERELNDFIAHEVRNPIAAAMSACSLVRSSLNEKETPQRGAPNEEWTRRTREDVDIIDSSLVFVNDLLRNMLDMHRSCNNQLSVKLELADLLLDVFEPVGAMLHQRRGAKIRVEIECPSGLVVLTDRLRLKQVLLNLGRNSVKFTQEGFIRLRAVRVDDCKNVVLSIEDSGPGIPLEKRDLLFSKFQESLDSLSQGTGVGLFLCKNLVDLMGGEIRHDPDYNSGIAGRPGTKFVIDLQREPLDPNRIPYQYDAADAAADNVLLSHESERTKSSSSVNDDTSPLQEQQNENGEDLPKNLEALFVDDDPILRKLFSRTVKRVAPDWNIREAASGEAALDLCEMNRFDLIFMDMYMASVDRQLLGTETVMEMRDRGITSRICGLSANDKESEFIEAGADAFIIKPFPCEAGALRDELKRVLYS